MGKEKNLVLPQKGNHARKGGKMGEVKEKGRPSIHQREVREKEKKSCFRSKWASSKRGESSQRGGQRAGERRIPPKRPQGHFLRKTARFQGVYQKAEGWKGSLKHGKVLIICDSS